EFQSYALEGKPFRPLIRSDIDESAEYQIARYFTPSGEPLSLRSFVEHFTMSIIASYLALRDEGFMEGEIEISVGTNGSCQLGKSELGTQVFVAPASIPDQAVQDEIIRCVREACALIEEGKADLVSVLQAKAKNRYILKRAFMRQFLKS